MKNKYSVTIATAGLSLLAASQAMAQNTYNALDLLLDFRNASTPTLSDVTVDLGNANTFISRVSALPGGLAVLDSGSGFATSSYSPQFAFSDLTDLLGAPATDNEIGFSAAASDHSVGSAGTGLIYLTRKQSGTTEPTTHSQQQGTLAQGDTSIAIFNIGLETEGSDVTPLPSGGNNAVSYSSGDPNSYQGQGEASVNSPSLINYGSSQNTASGAGGVMESEQTGAATIYEALWKVPVTGSGSVTYLGYFIFKANGELDFSLPTTTPTVPNVSISPSGSNVIISWPDTSNFTLVESSSVTGPWTANTLSTNSSGGTDSVTVPASATTEFFKLRYP